MLISLLSKDCLLLCFSYTFLYIRQAHKNIVEVQGLKYKMNVSNGSHDDSELGEQQSLKHAREKDKDYQVR